LVKNIPIHPDTKSILPFFVECIIEKQAEDPLPSGGGMNAVPTAIELEAK
jgi:hypothetical protein